MNQISVFEDKTLLGNYNFRVLKYYIFIKFF